MIDALYTLNTSGPAAGTGDKHGLVHDLPVKVRLPTKTNTLHPPSRVLNGKKRVRDSSVLERASIRLRPSALVRYPALLRGVDALIGPRVRSSPTVPLYHATRARLPVSLAVCSLRLLALRRVPVELKLTPLHVGGVYATISSLPNGQDIFVPEKISMETQVRDVRN